MRRFRPTIGSLLLLVFLCGLAFAALREPSELWDHIVFTSTVVLFLAGLVLIIFRTGRSRAFWVGFLVFGAPLFVLNQMPPVRTRLLTTHVLVYLDRTLVRQSIELTPQNNQDPSVQALVHQPGWVFGIEGSTGKLFASNASMSEHFFQVGYSLMALVAGLAGGVFATMVASPGQRRAAPPEPVLEPNP